MTSAYPCSQGNPAPEEKSGPCWGPLTPKAPNMRGLRPCFVFVGREEGEGDKSKDEGERRRDERKATGKQVRGTRQQATVKKDKGLEGLNGLLFFSFAALRGIQDS